MKRPTAILLAGAGIPAVLLAGLLLRGHESLPNVAKDEIDEERVQEVFEVDAGGRLVLNEQTRRDIEAFVARTDARQLGPATQELAQTLPPAAGAQAADLIDRYYNYQLAQEQDYRKEDAPRSDDDSTTLLASLHTLRVAHFGPEVAQAFYGQEEVMTRELLDLMRLETDQTPTIAEKAAR